MQNTYLHVIIVQDLSNCKSDWSQVSLHPILIRIWQDRTELFRVIRMRTIFLNKLSQVPTGFRKLNLGLGI